MRSVLPHRVHSFAIEDDADSAGSPCPVPSRWCLFCIQLPCDLGKGEPLSAQALDSVNPHLLVGKRNQNPPSVGIPLRPLPIPSCSPIPIRAQHVLPPNALLPQPADSQASSPAGPFQRNPAFPGFLLLRLLPPTSKLLRIDSLPQTVHTSRRSPLSAHLACERT